MFGLNKTRITLGLDIGSYAVKAVELKPKKIDGEYSFEVKRIGYELLPKDSIVDGTIIDASAVVETIKILFAESKMSNKNIVISVSGNSVIIKKIALPRMEPEELSETIIWEAKHNIPYPYEETSIDYCILKPARRADDNTVEVLLVAAKKDKITNYVGIIDQLNKKPKAIEVDVFALYNIAEFNYPDIFNTKNLAIINLGANSINIIVIEKGIPQLFRDLPIGGSQISENLSKTLNIDFDDAEKILKGLPIENKQPEQYQTILEMNMQNLLEEIRKTFSFFGAGSKSQEGIEAILLAGGLAKFRNMDRKFEESFNIKTGFLNPFNRIHIDPKKFSAFDPEDMAPNFCIAAGLATRQQDG